MICDRSKLSLTENVPVALVLLGGHSRLAAFGFMAWIIIKNRKIKTGHLTAWEKRGSKRTVNVSLAWVVLHYMWTWH